MQNSFSIHRRIFAAAMGSGFLASCVDVWALSQPAPSPPTLKEKMQRSDLVIVGVVRKITFRGIELTDKSHAYDSLGNNGEESGKVDLVVQVKSVLFNPFDYLILDSIQIGAWDSPKNLKYELMERKIFLLKNVGLSNKKDPTSRRYTFSSPAISAEEEIEAKKIAVEIGKQK